MSENTLADLMGLPPAPSKKIKKLLAVGEADETAPEKPQRIIDSELKSGIEYEWSPEKKQWRPKQGVR